MVVRDSHRSFGAGTSYAALTRRGTFGVLGLLALQACGLFPRYSLNYQLKVVLRVGEASYSGQSVIAVTFTDQEGSCCGPSYSVRVVGEAPMVDLGSRGPVFALLNRLEFGDVIAIDQRYAADLPVNVLSPRFPNETAALRRDSSHFPELFEKIRGVREEVRIPALMHPTLVRFRDIAEPGSIEIIAASNIAEILGGDVSIEGCSIQIVDRPVTKGLKDVLPWLEAISRRGLDRTLLPSLEQGFDGNEVRRSPPHVITDQCFIRSR